MRTVVSPKFKVLFANVLFRSGKKRNECSLSDDAKKCDAYVYTSFFQPQIRRKQLGPPPPWGGGLLPYISHILIGMCRPSFSVMRKYSSTKWKTPLYLSRDLYGSYPCWTLLLICSFSSTLPIKFVCVMEG